MDEWQLHAINLRSITRFLLPSLYLTILAGILIFWPKTLPQTIPRWHCSCTGFPTPKSSYLHHCVNAGTLQGQQTALGRTDTWPSPRGQCKGHCPVKPCIDWPGKHWGFASPQSWPPKRRSFRTLHGISRSRGGIWHFSKSTQISGPLSNTAKKAVMPRKSCLSSQILYHWVHLRLISLVAQRVKCLPTMW